jgi:DNA-binding CsgD family transcriptional regulator
MSDALTNMTERSAPGAEVLTIGSLLAHALDEVDYGIVLIGADGRVLHLNRRARQLLQADTSLRLQAGRLTARQARDQECLQTALKNATQRGLRAMLALGDDEHRQLAALVPVQDGAAALLLGRTNVCEELSLQCFARTHALTSAETRVLAALGRGEAPAQIARDQGVALCTVRTQIGSIRGKTGTGSITALMRLIGSLPPVMGRQLV